MTVAEMLKQHPAEDVLSVLVARERVGDEHKEMFCQKYRGVIEELKSRTATPDAEHIILGHRYFSDGRDFPDASLFVKADITNEFKPLPELDGLDDIDALADDDVERLLSLKSAPISYAFDFIPWNEILGYNLDERNLQDAGAVNVLAAVLYELTFYGFREADMEAERDELKRRDTELNEILKLPPDEQKNHLKAHKEALEELEIADERRAWNREDLRNKIQRYQAVRRYWEAQAD